LGAHGQTEAVVEERKALEIRTDYVDVLELEPLAAEVFDQRGGLRVAQHSFDLRGEDHGLAQAAASGKAQEFGVGRAAPEEIGEARRQLVWVHWRGGLTGRRRVVPLDAIEEGWRDQRRLKGCRDALFERITVFARKSGEA